MAAGDERPARTTRRCTSTRTAAAATGSPGRSGWGGTSATACARVDDCGCSGRRRWTTCAASRCATSSRGRFTISSTASSSARRPAPAASRARRPTATTSFRPRSSTPFLEAARAAGFPQRRAVAVGRAVGAAHHRQGGARAGPADRRAWTRSASISTRAGRSGSSPRVAGPAALPRSRHRPGAGRAASARRSACCSPRRRPWPPWPGG